MTKESVKDILFQYSLGGSGLCIRPLPFRLFAVQIYFFIIPYPSVPPPMPPPRHSSSASTPTTKSCPNVSVVPAPPPSRCRPRSGRCRDSTSSHDGRRARSPSGPVTSSPIRSDSVHAPVAGSGPCLAWPTCSDAPAAPQAPASSRGPWSARSCRNSRLQGSKRWWYWTVVATVRIGCKRQRRGKSGVGHRTCRGRCVPSARFDPQTSSSRICSSRSTLRSGRCRRSFRARVRMPCPPASHAI